MHLFNRPNSRRIKYHSRLILSIFGLFWDYIVRTKPKLFPYFENISVFSKLITRISVRIS